jgi:hypothetical protein
MAAAPLAAPVEAPPPIPRPRPRPARRTRPRSRLTGGVLWIVALAFLFAGVVALNVAVLRLNMRYDELGGTKVSLVGQNAALSSELSSAAATGRIERLARSQLRLVPADPSTTHYIQLTP